MKIVSIHVVAFGKLKNVDLQLNSGLNVIKQVNSFGKTTMASFIRAMLYGLAPARSKDNNNVSRFAPWGSTDRFGGSIVIEHNNEIYRIERFFGATARQETLKITNEKTGREISWQKQPGEMLLGLTAESYDRSAYFPQEAVELATNENLDSRLANLVENSAEDYDKVQDKLRAYKKNLRYERGLGGEIYQLEEKKRQLGEQLSRAQNAETRAVEIDKRLAQIKEENTALTRRQAEYNEKLSKLQCTVAQAQPTDGDNRVKARLHELNEKLSRIPSEFDSDFQRCDVLAKQISETPDQQKQRKPSKALLFLAGVEYLVGVIFILLGILQILTIVVGLSVGVPCLIAGAIFTLLAISGNKKKVKMPVSNKKGELMAQYLQLAGKYVYTDGVDYETVKRNLWQAHVNYQGDARERDTLLSVTSRSQTDTTKVEQDIQNVLNVLSALNQQMSALATETGRLSEERKMLVFNSVDIMDQLLTVEEDVKNAIHRYEVADAVAKLLEQAKDNLSSSYLPKLCARCSQLLQEITQNEFAVVVDRNFTLSIREKGQTKPISEFSRGIREITLLCFRVALSELLYDGAIPFVIIDDAFVNFDEDNFTRATTLLKQLSAHAQVIYFTCHNRMGNLLR